MPLATATIYTYCILASIAEKIETHFKVVSTWLSITRNGIIYFFVFFFVGCCGTRKKLHGFGVTISVQMQVVTGLVAVQS